MFLIVVFLIGLLAMFALEDAQKKKRRFSEKKTLSGRKSSLNEKVKVR